MTFLRSIIILLAVSGASAFVVSGDRSNIRPSTILHQGDGTGGWGIGSSREISPEEFARGERSAFDGYKMQERGDFMRSLKAEQDAQTKAELDELLGVAKMAGFNVKDPKSRLNKFEPDILSEDDDLDVSVDLD